MRTNSDSEVLLNVFAEDLQREINLHPLRDPSACKYSILMTQTMQKLRGSYSVISLVNDVGVFAFRDPNGIRPLVLGQRVNADGKDEWCVASGRRAAFGPLGFKFVRDVNPGEAIIITNDGKMVSRQCVSARRMPVHFRVHLFGQTRFDHEWYFRVTNSSWI